MTPIARSDVGQQLEEQPWPASPAGVCGPLPVFIFPVTLTLACSRAHGHENRDPRGLEEAGET